jgi:ribosome modulation factor
MSSGFGLATPRLGWHNKGFSDGRYHDVKKPPDDPEARASYLKGWRSGHRERLKAQAEGRP